MNRFTGIVLIWILGFYTFTQKTHYCYYSNGERYHGNCGAGRPRIVRRNFLVIYADLYNCVDIYKDGLQFKQDHTTFNFYTYFAVPPNFQYNNNPQAPIIKSWGFRIFLCRGGPPLTAESLRGPPVSVA